MTAPPVDLTNCDREPIHQPGAVQPHGILLACRPHDLAITHVSENIERACGISPRDLAGTSVADLFPAESRASYVEILTREVADTQPHYLFTVRLAASTAAYDAIAHRNGEHLFLELEPSEVNRDHTAPELYRMVQHAIARMQRAGSVEELCRICAEQVARINGFDRVMTYRFDPEWNGQVVAEEKRADLEPFLGLHYPASDIPQQARRLYTKNWLRFITNRDYAPSRIVPESSAPDAAPLDLSFSVLRSVSPIHLEYLRNMGVSATMSVSLVRDDRLWGLIACHHYSPRFVPYDVRTACELLGQFMSLSLAAAEDRERSDYRESAARMIGAMTANVSAAEDVALGLTEQQPDLLKFLPSDGAAVIVGDRVTRIGQTPNERDILAIARWIAERQTGNLFATDHLTADFGTAILTGAAGGVLAITLSSGRGHQILWFRAEQVRHVDWAGDPRKTMSKGDGEDVRLSPRGSFALWKETVHGRSEPWKIEELEAAERLREALVSELIRRTEILAAANNDLRLAGEEREKALETERRARLESERVSRMKDDFVATLSHELRTPLSAILGWAQVLTRTGDLSPDVTGGLEVIERNARSQAQMIEDLLDMSRVISGNLRLDVQDTHLPSIVKSAVETVSLTAQAKEVRLETVIDPLHGVRTTGDPHRLQQVVWNLLSNAVKFTPRGGKVQVFLERVSSHVELTVADTGKGIDPAFLPYVFDRFRQEESSRSRKFGGLGLGLSIVRSLVELHGGSVRAFSRGENYGSMFVVSLPVRAVKADPEPGTPPAADAEEENCLNLRGLRILEVDDEPDARELVRAILRECQCSVHLCSSAREALDALETESFDLIISDIGMPERDGFEFMRAWREREVELGRVKTPAVAMTAYARGEDRRRALLAGFQSHLPKPIDREELLAIIASLTGRM